MKLWILIVGLLLVALTLFPNDAGADWSDNSWVRIALHVGAHFTPSEAFPDLCSGNPLAKNGLDCSQFNTAFGTNDFPGPHVYIVAGQGGPEGILGASFGVDYTGSAGSGIDPQYVLFTSCTDGTVFPDVGPNGEFPAPGGGICVSWATCQNSLAPNGISGVHAVIGALYMYAYSPASVRITPNNNLATSEFAVTDCSYNTINILDVTSPSLVDHLGGRVDFGGGFGFTPCSHHHHWKGEKSAVSPGPTSTFCGLTPARKTTWGVIKDFYRVRDNE